MSWENAGLLEATAKPPGLGESGHRDPKCQTSRLRISGRGSPLGIPDDDTSRRSGRARMTVNPYIAIRVPRPGIFSGRPDLPEEPAPPTARPRRIGPLNPLYRSGRHKHRTSTAG